MSEVIGPISTLSGTYHDCPEGQMCDQHPDRLSVARIQGETDSFGCEMHDMCQECLDDDKAWRKSPEAAEYRKGRCDWCKEDALDLRDARDYEEGLCGRVYRVCGACIKKQNDNLVAEDQRDLDDWDDLYEGDDYPDDYDDSDYEEDEEIKNV